MGEEPSSPRCFPKDNSIEDQVRSSDFAIGLLLNLLQIRMEVAASGRKLDDVIAEGTPTSKFWLQKWMAEWTSGSSLNTSNDIHVEAIQTVKNYHMQLYAAKKTALLQCQVEANPTMARPRTRRWPDWIKALANAGHIGRILFQKTVEKSRKGTTQSAFKVLSLDIFQYDVLFSDMSVFGDWNSYQYDPGNDPPRHAPGEFNVDFECPVTAVPSSRRTVVCQAFELVNIEALTERSRQDPSISGERRLEGLRAHVAEVQTQGWPVHVSGVNVQRCEESRFWERCCDFEQIDGMGRAYQVRHGIQSATRESRPVAFKDLCVGELDLIKAFYQLFLKAVAGYVDDDAEFDSLYGIIEKFLEHPDVWTEKISAYYSITSQEVKIIFSRLMFDGSIRPDTEWEPTKEG